MAGPEKKCKKCPPKGAPAFMTTYGDMVTLLLTFFVLLYTTAEVDGYQLRLILAAFQGLGNLTGGNTLEEGPLAELGNTVERLPSLDQGTSLAEARREAVSLFEPQIRNQTVRVTPDERGLVISLASDALFRPASAELNLEASREVIQNLAQFLSSGGLSDRTFRVEGHTDSVPTDPGGEFQSNWELSVARSLNVFRAILDYRPGDDAFEDRFQIMGLGDTNPLADNDTAEGRALNRRVDIIVLSDGTL